jgi:hypothetical protein
MRRVLALLVALVVASVASLVTQPQSGDQRAGQMVFVADSGSDLPADVRRVGGTTSIMDCEPTDGGLLVSGKLVGPWGGLIVVAVSGGAAAGQAGLRLGRGFLVSVDPSAHDMGDFVITIPWASSDSSFAVVGATGQRGVPAYCP